MLRWKPMAWMATGIVAYYDDGTPLGSVQNMECRIDSIAQSWVCITGAADSDRAASMKAVTERLVIGTTV